MNRVFNFNLHYKCGNYCRNCISHNTKEYSSAFLSFDDIRNVFDIYAPDDGDIIIISGGEPSLYEDISSLLYYIRKRSACRIVAYSNGEGWGDTEKLEAAASCLDRITLSCYGLVGEHIWQSGNERSFENLYYAFTMFESQRKSIDCSLSIEFKYVSTRHAPCRVEKILASLEHSVQLDSIVLSRMLGEHGELCSQSLWAETMAENLKVLRKDSRWSHIPLKLVDIQPCLLGKELFAEIEDARPIRMDKEILFFDGRNTNGKRLYFQKKAYFFPKCEICQLSSVCGTTATCYGALLWKKESGWSYADE